MSLAAPALINPFWIAVLETLPVMVALLVCVTRALNSGN